MRKSHKIISYVFAAVFLCAGVTIIGAAVFLHRGIHLEHFSWKNVEVESFYIVWDNKIRVSIENINITTEDSQSSSSFGVPDFSSYLKAGKYVGSFISEIRIANLDYNDFSGTFHYTGWSDGVEGAIQLSSPDIIFDLSIKPDENDLILTINELSSRNYNSGITGSVRLTDKALATGELLIDVAGTLPLDLSFTVDNSELSFSGNGIATVDSIKPIVDLFQLSPAVSPWISEYLKGSSYELIYLEGSLPWDDPASFLDNLRAKVRVHDCQYTFRQGLEPIETEYTDVVFQKNVLKIYPHNARFHGQDCEKSWVKIDFTKPSESILTVYIDTHAVINDDIINLLNSYGIFLPFKQVEGKTATDLVLEINLSTIDLDATGTFKIDQGAISFNGMTFDVADCLVLLKNSEITIKHLQVMSPEFFATEVAGKLDFGKKYGDVTAIVADLKLKNGDSEIILHNGEKKLSYTYHLRPDGDSIEFSGSTWQLDSGIFHLATFTAPFDLKSGVLSLPPTAMSSTRAQSEVMISGDINLKNKTGDLILDLDSIKRGNIKLAQPHLRLGVQIDNGIKISILETSEWLIHNIDTTISPVEIHYQNDNLTIGDGHIIYGDFFDGSIQGSYNFTTRNGAYFISELQVKNETLGTLLDDHDGFEVIVSGNEKGSEFDIPLFDIKIVSGKDKAWQVTFGDLKKLAGRFPVLERYYLTNGTLSLGSKNGRRPYHFKGTINYPYSIFVVDGSPVNRYDFYGVLSEKEFRVRMIDQFTITANEKITITSDNIEYNVVELLKLLKCLSSENNGSSREVAAMNLELTARNSSLYFRPENRVLADKLLMRIQDGEMHLWFKHGSGNGSLVVEDGRFFLDGTNLDDSFMEAMLAGSKFSGGTLSFAGSGDLENFDAHFKIDDTVLGDYSVMNNVLAFVNTIPALITFSVPDYSTEGMAVESAVLDLTYRDKSYEVNTLEVNASVLTIRGTGKASISEDSIDLKLNLITQARKDLSKIPLIGYVLVGDEELPSVKLEVTGKLSDPDVNNSVFEEIVTLPFGIAWRVLKSPFKWIEDLFLDENQSAESDVVDLKPANNQ